MSTAVLDQPAPRVGTGAAVVALRIGRGMFALGINALVNTVAQLSIVPVALLLWGKTRYGEWVLISGLVTVLKLADLGLQTHVVNQMTAAYANDNEAGLRRVLASALRVQLPLIGAIWLGLVGILLLVNGQQMLALSTVNRPAFVGLALLLASEVLVGVPAGVIAGMYRATRRLSRGAWIGTVQQVVLLAATLSLIAAGGGFRMVAATRVGVSLAVTAFVVMDLRRRHPWLTLWFRDGSWREGIAMVIPGAWFLLIPLADYASTQATLAVVQRSLGPAEVSRLATHRTIASVGVMVSGLLANAAWPEFTSLRARGEIARLGQIYRTITRANVWLVSLTLFALVPFTETLYSTWTLHRLTFDALTLSFLFARTIVWASWTISMILLMSIDCQRVVAIALFCGSAITFLSACALVPRFGLPGAALATLVGDLAVPAWLMPRMAAHEFQLPGHAVWRDALLTFTTTIVGPGALGLVIWLVGQNVTAAVSAVGVGTLTSCFVAWRSLPPAAREFVGSTWACWWARDLPPSNVNP